MNTPNHKDRIVVVTGLARCGASAIMHMLHAGGMNVVADEFITYHLALSEQLPKEKDWVGKIRGSAVKILYADRHRPPGCYPYDFILVTRNHEQQAKSHLKTLAAHRQIPPEKVTVLSEIMGMSEKMAKRDAELLEALKRYNHSRILPVTFEDIIASPDSVADAVNTFVGGQLNVSAMADAILRRSSDCHPDMIEDRVRRAIIETQAAMSLVINRRQEQLKPFLYDTDAELQNCNHISNAQLALVNYHMGVRGSADTPPTPLQDLTTAAAHILAEIVRLQQTAEVKG